jgi:hypothetical protein
MKLYALKDSDGWTNIKLLRTQDSAVEVAVDLCAARVGTRHYTCQVLEIDTETETMRPMVQLVADAGGAAPVRVEISADKPRA